MLAPRRAPCARGTLPDPCAGPARLSPDPLNASSARRRSAHLSDRSARWSVADPGPPSMIHTVPEPDPAHRLQRGAAEIAPMASASVTYQRTREMTIDELL